MLKNDPIGQPELNKKIRLQPPKNLRLCNPGVHACTCMLLL